MWWEGESIKEKKKESNKQNIRNEKNKENNEEFLKKRGTLHKRREKKIQLNEGKKYSKERMSKWLKRILNGYRKKLE